MTDNTQSGSDTNQASEDELKERIGNLHAYNYDGDDVTVKVMVDEDILESIAEFVEAIIRTEKLKLLAEVRERVVGEDLPLPDEFMARTGTLLYNRIKSEERGELTKLEAELC